ncbi:MAG TPA: hypothetical protein VGF28_16490 [Thermoanaerobaculia bacterium]
MKLAATALVALLAYGGVFASLMKTHGGDVSRMVVAGGGGVDPAKVPPGLTVIPNIGGYDGMMFYRLALDPFTREQEAYGIKLDEPSYRQQRILYPLILWVLSLGNPERVPLLMPLVNLLGIAVMAAAAGALAMHYGLAPFWGLFFPLYPGFIVTFSRDTSEIAAWAFASCAMWTFAAQRWKLCTLLLCCAMLTRETTLLLAIGIGLVWLFRRNVPPATFVIPGALYAAWQAFLGWWWQQVPLLAGTPDRTIPFSGYVDTFIAASSRRTAMDRIQFMECIFWPLLVAIVIAVWRRSRAHSEWRAAWGGAFLLAALLAHDVWGEHYAYMRALTELFALSVAIVFGAGRGTRWTVATVVAVLWWQVAKHV